MFFPKRSHEFELKRLEQYLKHTQYRGLLLDPNSDIFKVDAFPDYDFAGMYGQENTNDPACAKSLTGFNITFYDCSVLFIHKLQTETTLSKMESDTIAPTCCC